MYCNLWILYNTVIEVPCFQFYKKLTSNVICNHIFICCLHFNYMILKHINVIFYNVDDDRS